MSLPSHHQSDHHFDSAYLPPPRQDSVIAALAPGTPDWQSMYPNSMSAAVATTRRPFKRVRTHERTPSASTVATQDGPASPFAATTSYPVIANSDYSPRSSAYYSEQASYPKALLTPQPTPTDATFVSSAYNIPSQVAHAPHSLSVMKGYNLNPQFSEDFAVPDFYQSSRHSMSSGHDSSPATPQSNAGEVYNASTMQMQQNDYRQPSTLVTHPSQPYQDDMYTPAAYTSTPMNAVKRSADYLTPHRNPLTERLQTANMARSASPTSAVSRERSPFREHSPLAPGHEWNHAGPVGTAASIRQQQKEEAEQAEYAQHMPTLRREPTKTISPKDAVLDYHETDQPSLFQEQIPAGYRQHGSGADGWSTNFVGQPGASFGNLTVPVTNTQSMTSFRATANDDWEANLSYMHLPPQEQAQIPATSFPGNAYAAPRMNYQESNPEFPAQLTSMESSISDGGPPLSSQNSFNTASTTIQRPVDTRANTGTYTCTYHGCTERFDSHINLQKHKRDFHRSQHQQQMQHQQLRDQASATPSATPDSASPRSTESPAPSGSGMTSAALLARNSQAGPHKCERINPSTNKPCNTIFSRPYDLTRHEDTIHNNAKQKVRCAYCREEKTFSRSDALTRHMRVVHPEVESFGKRSRRAD